MINGWDLGKEIRLWNPSIGQKKPSQISVQYPSPRVYLDGPVHHTSRYSGYISMNYYK